MTDCAGVRAAHYLGAYSSWKMILSSVNSLSTLCARRPLRVPADGDEALACCKRRSRRCSSPTSGYPGRSTTASPNAAASITRNCDTGGRDRVSSHLRPHVRYPQRHHISTARRVFLEGLTGCNVRDDDRAAGARVLRARILYRTGLSEYPGHVAPYVYGRPSQQDGEASGLVFIGVLVEQRKTSAFHCHHCERRNRLWVSSPRTSKPWMTC